MAGQGAIYPSLAGRRVLVTGGASGIGAAMVAAFAAQGCAVAFLDIDRAHGEALAATLAHLPHPPRYTPCDLTDLDDLRRVIDAIEAAMGGIDVLINNAANDDRHTLAEVTPAYWDDRMAVNLRHLFFCAQAVAPGMRARGRGAVLNLSSISWHLGLPDLVLYQTAKAGIEGMTRALARDLGRDGVRVNAIVPGGVKTPRQDALWHDAQEEARIVEGQFLKGRVLPEDVAAMALFLASDDARMCTGHSYWVDAGWC